jgi:hypothetical protein
VVPAGEPSGVMASARISWASERRIRLERRVGLRDRLLEAPRRQGVRGLAQRAGEDHATRGGCRCDSLCDAREASDLQFGRRNLDGRLGRLDFPGRRRGGGLLLRGLAILEVLLAPMIAARGNSTVTPSRRGEDTAQYGRVVREAPKGVGSCHDARQSSRMTRVAGRRGGTDPHRQLKLFGSGNRTPPDSGATGWVPALRRVAAGG